MSTSDGKNGDKTVYKVVVDKGGRYSIWPADRENARGWRDAGKQGTEAQCNDYIKEAATYVDSTRPRSK